MTYVQRISSDLTDVPKSARVNPEHVIPMPSARGDAWYAVDYLHKTCTCTGFQLSRECDHLEDALELEKMFMENTIRIPSYTTEGLWYSVDVQARVCSCPHFVYRNTECKHLEDAFQLKDLFYPDEDSDSVYGDVREPQDSDSDSDSEVTSAYSGAPRRLESTEQSTDEGTDESTDESTDEEVDHRAIRMRDTVQRRLSFESSSETSKTSDSSDATWVPGMDQDLDSDDDAEFERTHLRNWRDM